MRTFLTALTCLMLFAPLVVAGEVEDAIQEGDALKEAMVAGDSEGPVWEGFEDIGAAVEAKDFGKAARLIKQYAEVGNARAQFGLGIMYRDGHHVPQNYVKAVYWYRKAAEQAHDVAQVYLGRMYDRGTGVPENNVQAYAWFSVSAAQGNSGAKVEKKYTQQKMTPDQIAKGQELAAEYWEKYVMPFQKD